MTNTLHRSGDAASFHDDYVVFAIPCRGRNDQGSAPKLKRFLELALAFHPVNIGDGVHGAALRPSGRLTPLAHWKRDSAPDFRSVIDGVDAATTVAAVFDNRPAAEDFLKALKEADLGLSVNISTSIDGADQCCDAAGCPRHSIGYSLGFEGKTGKLPATPVLMLADRLEPARLADWADAGAAGCVTEIESAEELAGSIVRARAGEVLFPSTALYRLLTGPARTASAPTGSEVGGQLRPHEIEVLRAVAEGLSMEEAATRLGVSPDSARTHLKRAMAAMGVSSRLEAVLRAMRAGLIRRP